MASNIVASDGDELGKMISHLQEDIEEIDSIVSEYDLSNTDIQTVQKYIQNANQYVENAGSTSENDEMEVLLSAANKCLTDAHEILNDPDKEYSIDGHDAFDNLQSSVEYLRSYLHGIKDEL